MAKPKAPTPQEIYRQRREREEKERSAYLPPGLINHGNTCFMNSVLQGLIATRLLTDLVYFQDIPPEIQVTAATPIVSRRSPQLTNGHNLAGSYEQPWINTMPIGDMFLTVMYKAWTSQAARTRDIISPKPILGALGQKYDQYLDFAQQDAHEFLRILLDAMRMEEQDIIKQRQPPRPKRRRRTTITPDDVHATPSDELPLLSFADMIFGGQLTSILVCQTCKHVSQSYEEFNDISLSIKGDDYMHNRKRNRIKKLMGRLTGNSSQEKEQPKNAGFIHAVEMLRASSVPPSPRTERDVQLGHEDALPNHKDTARRRSFDLPVESAEKDIDTDPSPAVPPGIAVVDSKSSTDTRGSVTIESENSHVLVNVISPEERHVEFAETASTTTENSGALSPSPTPKSIEKVQKQDDSNWAKIGRRISLSVGLGRPRVADKEKDRKERERKTRSIGPVVGSSSQGDASPRPLPEPGVSTPRMTLSPEISHSSREPSIGDSDSSVPPERPSSTAGGSPLLIATPKPVPARPAIPFNYRSPSPHRPHKSSHLNPDSAAASSSASPADIPRSKSPKPPKPSPAEAEYLRKILADVAMAPGNPFAAIFKPPMVHSSSSLHTSQALNGIPSASTGADGSTGAEKSSAASWLGMGVRQFTGVEECLRMFTAVEVLDGENKVGCRRCWKIQNGMLNTTKSKDSDADDDEEEGTEGAPAGQDAAAESTPRVERTRPLLQPLATARPTSQPRILASVSTPTVSYYTSLNDGSGTPTRSVSSLPYETGPVSETSEESPFSGSAANSENGHGRGPGGMSIPTISTTEPDTPTGPSAVNRSDVIAESLGGVTNVQPSVPSPHPKLTQELYGYPANSKDSLVIPQRRAPSRKPTNLDSSRTDDESDDLSDVSSVSCSSVGSRNSVTTSTNPSSVSQSSSAAPQGSAPPAPKEKKPSKPKPTIMRAAYKRYLIATPPPVLVIHLKRFQQTSKGPLMSFSHGFKKLDDYVSFPEYLDLAPFLAPKKEDYGLGRKAKHKDKKGLHHPKEERCMYRLYAVVVHIGNMLGGHYIAYTALPSESPVASSRSRSNVKSDAAASAMSAGSGTSAQNRQGGAANPSESASTPAKPKERQWAYISDTVVRLTTLEEVLHAKAYICMYERC